MLPAFAPSTNVSVSAGDAIKNSLKSDSLTESQRSSGDSFTDLLSQASKVGHASVSASSLQEQRPQKASRRDYSDYAFVTFFATGDKGDNGHTCDAVTIGFQFTSLDTKYARVLRKSHPGSRLALLTDMDTQFGFDGVDDIAVFRYQLDRSVLGRNAYANLYQFKAQLHYLERLQRVRAAHYRARAQEGAQLNVVFMDNDILVFKSLARIFESEDFDYGCTISDSPIMPVNIGMQFVKAGQYRQAISFLSAVIAQYRLEPIEEFCAGQIAIKEVLRLQESYEEQIRICAQAARDCYAIRDIAPHRIAFLSCTRYNYCNLEDSCCTDPYRWMKPLVCPQDFLDADVCALHFVGWRKTGMPAVYEAFMRGDLEAGFQAFVDNYKKFAGYVPGGHGNQRGQLSDKQPEQRPPSKQPGEVSGFYQLGFA